MQDVENNIPLPNNSEYDSNHTIVAVLSSTTDTNNFCNTYNHDNKYNGLKLGQRIQINDGTYNINWYIAGFDYEYNQTASNGSSYNNGYGICLVPETLVFSEYVVFNTYHLKNVGYLGSTIHTSTLSTIASNMKRVLGSHLINRKVLLGNSYSHQNGTSYTWTTAYCTLMSTYQVLGVTLQNANKYGVGEASYHLPIFKYMSACISGYDYWTRCLYNTTGYNPGTGSYVNIYQALMVCRGDTQFMTEFGAYIYAETVSDIGFVRPMIYIR